MISCTHVLQSSIADINPPFPPNAGPLPYAWNLKFLSAGKYFLKPGREGMAGVVGDDGPEKEGEDGKKAAGGGALIPLLNEEEPPVNAELPPLN